jgi:hypothetical protein
MVTILFIILVICALFALVVWFVIGHHFRTLAVPNEDDLSKKITRVFLIGSLVLLLVSALLALFLLI